MNLNDTIHNKLLWGLSLRRHSALVPVPYIAISISEKRQKVSDIINTKIHQKGKANQIMAMNSNSTEKGECYYSHFIAEGPKTQRG